ncbi:hypothetical protein H312_00010 [Anncaliia algerae PRA339]|uniref:Uncharacterized protein n=1 Tax=Anncaliia algerae PRA339 TaxID=1288291 RepID=A0A059F5G8_9MICR|nr:hypothetical protein H312_00010 [Anncaliia algerae PRA339]
MINEQILSLGFMFILKTKASNTYNTSEYEELYTINWQEKIDNPRPCQSRTDNFRTFTTIPDETYISRHNQESEQILLDSFANDDYIDAQTRGSTLNCDTKQLLDGKNPTFCTLCLNIYMCEHIKERVDIVQGKKNSNSNKNSVNEFNVTDILDKNTKDVEKLFPYQFINKPEENHRNTEQVRQTINP